jgi:tetratricopeptide (TPR) repeat protein
MWFVLSLGPTSQIMPHHIARADRFLYLPLVGLAVALALGIRPLGRFIQNRDRAVGVIAAGLASVLLLATRSARQVEIWRNSRSICDHCLSLNPRSPETLANLAWTLATCRDPALRDYDLALELAAKACRITGRKDARIVRKLALVYTSLASDLQSRGRFDEAIENYDKAIDADPKYDLPWFNQSLLLTTCPDTRLRQPDEAVHLAEQGCRLVDQPDAHRLAILAAAYAEADRFQEAVHTIQLAIQRARVEKDWAALEELEHLRDLYQNSNTSDSVCD